MSTVATTVPVRQRSKGRGYFWAGIGVCLFGIALCVAQYSLSQLIVPWYVAALATLGVLLLLWSVIQRASVVRVVVLALPAALAAFQWYFLVSLARPPSYDGRLPNDDGRLPNYDGPARGGEKIPAFRSTLADGRPFTEKDLQQGTPSVLVFFRGRWSGVCMTELGQLEAEYREFEKRKARVVVASLEGHETAKVTQAAFPHLVVVADTDRNLAEALDVIHRQSAPNGGDTAAPTTIVVDGGGTVWWTFRPQHIFGRPSPAQVLVALDSSFMVSLAGLPAYDGPARAGEKIPAFRSTLADGRPFTQNDLQQGTPTVLVFFRGRW
ncbi:MAG: redoxin domain-containing protein [Pirellulales bacterium]